LQGLFFVHLYTEVNLGMHELGFRNDPTFHYFVVFVGIWDIAVSVQIEDKELKRWRLLMKKLS